MIFINFSAKVEHFWTAGSKLVDKKNWIWMTTGEVIEYTNWGSGQPDNPNSELCLELWLFKNKGLFFNDRDCNTKFPFICEESKRRPGSSQNENSGKRLSAYHKCLISFLYRLGNCVPEPQCITQCESTTFWRKKLLLWYLL